MLPQAEHLHKGDECLGSPMGWILSADELEISSGLWIMQLLMT